MVAHTANETATLDHDVNRLRYKEFYAAAESVETRTMKRFTTIDVLVAAIVNATTDASAVFTNGQRAL